MRKVIIPLALLSTLALSGCGFYGACAGGCPSTVSTVSSSCCTPAVSTCNPCGYAGYSSYGYVNGWY